VKIVKIIWHKHILCWWHSLWIRKDEFHYSLDLNLEAMEMMNLEERIAYEEDLARRRKIAHERSIKKN